MFPFAAFIVSVPFVLIGLAFMRSHAKTRESLRQYDHLVGFIVPGLLICVVALVLGAALAASYTRYRRVTWSALLLALLGIVLVLLLYDR